MNLLAIDASASGCSVGLRAGDRSLERVSLSPRTHAQMILPMVSALLEEAGIQLSDLDAIAYGAGPGSFTGLRIAFGFAQGLGYGLNIPLLPVDSLLGLANHWLLTSPTPPMNSTVVSLLDARMEELYWSAFSVTEHGLQEKVRSSLNTIEETSKIIKAKVQSGDTFLVGPGANYLDCGDHPDVTVNADLEPSALAILNVGALMYKAGNASTASTATLNYLRNSVSWNKRVRIRQNTP